MSSSQPHRRSKTTQDGSFHADDSIDFAEFPSSTTSKRPSERQPILKGMDADNNESSQNVSAAGSTRKIKRPNVLMARAKTTGAISEKTKSSTQKTKKFFGFKQSIGGVQQEDRYTTYEYVPQTQLDRVPIQIGTRKIAVWPYDDYHLIQKHYYEKLQETAGEQLPSQRAFKQRQLKDKDSGSEMPVFKRPDDPSDIPKAVKGLSLTAFERTAEARAINIVGCWLFDAELIDELLANGGMTARTLKDRDNDDDDDDGEHKDENASQTTEKTSEGVEVGANGTPLEGSTKMDKEIAKLRSATKRQLALINARLNDGVTATGAEVQELVNAVIATKDEITRLRELSSYITNKDDVNNAKMLFGKFSKLKSVTHARRNINRVFRELDFFGQIPGTCDRLREELHAGEWTANEWSSLRSVAREHVDLEIFLIEADALMKEKNPENTKVIDGFLEHHIQNVWELGEEIRLRIMSGIRDAYDLAMENPAGMVALVEAIEVYEMATADYKAQMGGHVATRNAKRAFTDMRSTAIAELYKDFETRCFTIFQDYTTDVADTADEEEAQNKRFTAILRAADNLAREVPVVKRKMDPCFPPNWAIATLWTTCVAHICSNNILQQVGGPYGTQLHTLSNRQLMELVSWVEEFRKIISECFPHLGSESQHTYLNEAPKLLEENGKTIDVKLAEDSLIWANNSLWTVHDLARDAFMMAVKGDVEKWFSNVYELEYKVSQVGDGLLITSLCEDVYHLAGLHIRTITESLKSSPDATTKVVGLVISYLFELQMLHRDKFCTDLETCCAAANDFVRMSDKCEDIVEEVKKSADLTDTSLLQLEEQSASLLTLYSNDAVYAAKYTNVYCFQPIEEAVASELFGPQWESELTSNELALTLVRTLDDFMEDLETFLEDLMVTKAVEAQIFSAVNFYIKCMLNKSAEHKNNRRGLFDDNERAIDRMRGDAKVMRDYFVGLAESMPSLARLVESEFSLLDAVFELLAVAAGLSSSDPQDFVLMLQKKIKNQEFTKLMVGDIWHLVNPTEEGQIYEMMEDMTDTLEAVAPTDETRVNMYGQDRSIVPGVNIDEVLAKHAKENKRKRPMNTSGGWFGSSTTPKDKEADLLD